MMQKIITLTNILSSSLLICIYLLLFVGTAISSQIEINDFTVSLEVDFCYLNYKVKNEGTTAVAIYMEHFVLKKIEKVEEILGEHTLSHVNTVAVISFENFKKTFNNRGQIDLGDNICCLGEFPRFKILYPGKCFNLTIRLSKSMIENISDPIFFLKLKYGDLENFEDSILEDISSKEIKYEKIIIEVKDSVKSLEKKLGGQHHGTDTRIIFVGRYFDHEIFFSFLNLSQKNAMKFPSCFGTSNPTQFKNSKQMQHD